MINNFNGTGRLDVDDPKPLEVGTESIGVNLNRNFSWLMENNRVTLSMLHRNTGIAMPTIKRLQSDPTTNPTIATLQPIANFFGITITQLIGNNTPTQLGYLENKAYWLEVPLIEWNQVTDWLIPENQIQIKTKTSIFVDVDVGKKPFALIVEDDDWQTIFKGSLLIVNSELTPVHKDYAIVSKMGQSTPTLKQVVVHDGEMYLKPMNPSFQTIRFSEDHRFLGVLIQIRKDTKI